MIFLKKEELKIHMQQGDALRLRQTERIRQESLDDRHMTVDVDDLHGFLRRGSSSAVYNGRTHARVAMSHRDALQTRIRLPSKHLSTALHQDTSPQCAQTFASLVSHG